MAIQTTDILYKLSIKTSSGGNLLPQTNVDSSLGGYISQTSITTGVLNNLFSDLSGDDNANSAVDYRCIFVHNNNSTLTLQNTVAWLTSQVAGGANVDIGVDAITSSPIAQLTNQAASVTTKYNAPAGVVFSNPTSKSAGVSLGNIQPGYCKAIWIRRSANNTVALSNDGATIRVEGDTAA